jgi:uncharacterized NAD(P)/FAD-binding protein YdhS
VRAKVSSVSTAGDRYRLRAGEADHDVEYLILATGYQPEFSKSFSARLGALKTRILQPADVEKMTSAELKGHVLIIGTGLTAIDICRRLTGQPGVTTTILSRRGLLPLPHGESRCAVHLPRLAGLSPLQIFQILRSIQQSGSLSWNAIADQVRPQAQKIWTCWTDQERARFLRHVKPYWEVIRHRIPPRVNEEIQLEFMARRLDLKVGRIQKVDEKDGRLSVEFRNRKCGSVLTLEADWIVVATGSSIDQSLAEAGLSGVRRCPYGFGYINESAPRLWAVGPASKAEFWEITAVPDIREQTRTIAAAIANDETGGRILSLLRLSAHPNAAGESYFVHMGHSLSFSASLLKLGCFSFVHAVLPFLFLDTTSATLRNLHPILSKRRQRNSTKA